MYVYLDTTWTRTRQCAVMMMTLFKWSLHPVAPVPQNFRQVNCCSSTWYILHTNTQTSRIHTSWVSCTHPSDADIVQSSRIEKDTTKNRGHVIRDCTPAGLNGMWEDARSCVNRRWYDRVCFYRRPYIIWTHLHLQCCGRWVVVEDDRRRNKHERK